MLLKCLLYQPVPHRISKNSIMDCYIFLRISFSPLSPIKKTPTNQQKNYLQPGGQNIMYNSASIDPCMSISPQQHHTPCKPAEDENKAQAQKDKYISQKWRKSSCDRQYCQLLHLIHTHCQTSNSFCLAFCNQWGLKPANSGRIAAIQLATCWNIRTARWQDRETEKGQCLDVLCHLLLLLFYFVWFSLFFLLVCLGFFCIKT